MSTLIIVNILLSISVIALVSYIIAPRLKQYYREKENLKQTQEKQYIKQIVLEFLEELKK